ncbi:hypothetical protein BAUCODRAFT_329043 [Baudoinia panamericana UAMH 10762]|uniref:GST N-terminal domain-containing protein n=1 Tax=Baudoinia panamericana (strain UAMH 10762) TaxID=717646 RepID=M2M4D2_BAUPA|nr:uncharacterized protein BAUCODRAFT_329043 [Baudoinia panamericana UAMH 10762]EMC91446.1 hypothetical protein BAUCODRAFT_329043 [Baudoinia panamericana UAMH 10762]
MSSKPKLFLHNHPVSSYAQKVRIALREKGIDFDYTTPKGLGSGHGAPTLDPINPRVEVPALEDGNFKIFDSTVILAYIEDKYPEKPLLPKNPQARATARMIEDVCDNEYEAVNWTYAEIAWAERATGEHAQRLIAGVKQQTAEIQAWLSEKLGEQQYFCGDEFSYADVCVAPMLNRSVNYGFGPVEGSPLQLWHARIKERPSVKATFEEMEEGAKVMSKGMKAMFTEGPNKRQYRSHRLEMMVKLGGIDVVIEGLKRDNIRFGWPSADL